MSIYSETMSNTPEDTTFEFMETTEPIVQDDPFEIYHKNWLISETLEDKGYSSVNMVFEHDEWVLQMDSMYVNRFVSNMKELGYSCTVIEMNPTKFRTFKRYRLVRINGFHPFDLLHVYRYLDVIK